MGNLFSFVNPSFWDVRSLNDNSAIVKDVHKGRFAKCLEVMVNSGDAAVASKGRGYARVLEALQNWEEVGGPMTCDLARRVEINIAPGVEEDPDASSELFRVLIAGYRGLNLPYTETQFQAFVGLLEGLYPEGGIYEERDIVQQFRDLENTTDEAALRFEAFKSLMFERCLLGEGNRGTMVQVRGKFYSDDRFKRLTQAFIYSAKMRDVSRQIILHIALSGLIPIGLLASACMLRGDKMKGYTDLLMVYGRGMGLQFLYCVLVPVLASFWASFRSETRKIPDQDLERFILGGGGEDVLREDLPLPGNSAYHFLNLIADGYARAIDWGLFVVEVVLDLMHASGREYAHLSLARNIVFKVMRVVLMCLSAYGLYLGGRTTQYSKTYAVVAARSIQAGLVTYLIAVCADLGRYLKARYERRAVAGA